MIFMTECCSEFQDIFDVDHFITSLRDEVRILKELPPRLKRRVELGRIYSMPPISWSDISYYHDQVSFSILFHQPLLSGKSIRALQVTKLKHS